MLNGKRLYVIFIALSFFLFQSNVSAGDSDVDTLGDPLVGITVSKDEIMKSLDNLKEEGKISDEEYKKAKNQLMGMKDSEVSGLRNQAVNMVRKDPDKTVDLYKGKSIDLKEVERQAREANPPK